MLPMTKAQSQTTQYRYRLTWLQLVRPMTWAGTITPVLAGTALAAKQGPIQWSVFVIFLAASLLVQMAVNIFNDYFDFKKGQDSEKWGVNENGPIFETIPVVASFMLLVAVFLGSWLALHSNEWIFIFGAIGSVAGFFYSAGKKALSAIGLGELVAALFLGIMVMGLAYAVQGVPWDGSMILMALPFASLIASMIHTNNIRDMEKDAGFRRTLPMIIGRQRAILLLTFLIIFPYLWVLLMRVLLMGEPTSLLIFFALPMALRLRWCFRTASPRKEILAAMRWSALHHWLFGLLYALGIWLGL